jgi:MATE family multidrug resistance protein
LIPRIAVEVLTLVASIIPLVALYQVFDAISAVTGGILRARGRQVRFSFSLLLEVKTLLTKLIIYRQATGALLNIRYRLFPSISYQNPTMDAFRSAYYLLGIPFGIYLAFPRKFGLHGLWFGFTVSLICTACVGIWLCVRTDWDHEVRKAAERLREGGDRDGRKDVDTERAVERAALIE